MATQHPDSLAARRSAQAQADAKACAEERRLVQLTKDTELHLKESLNSNSEPVGYLMFAWGGFFWRCNRKVTRVWGVGLSPVVEMCWIRYHEYEQALNCKCQQEVEVTTEQERDIPQVFALDPDFVPNTAEELQRIKEALAPPDEWDQAASEIVHLLRAKQEDYGPDNIMSFGELGVVVRLSDKIARLKNLTLNDKSPKNESVRDTFMDIAGYAIIGLMLQDGTFPPKETGDA